MVGSGGFRGGGGLVCLGAGLAGEWLRVEGLGGVGAAASYIEGDVPAQLGRHGLRHDQDGHPIINIFASAIRSMDDKRGSRLPL